MMTSPSNRNLIDSKEILKITGISRATLNNYIKVGILPRPLVRKPIKGLKTTKKIGYFPKAAVDRIELVWRLKREGNSMADIAQQLKDLPIAGEKTGRTNKRKRPKSRKSIASDRASQFYNNEFRLTFDDISFPAYFINFNFEIEWMNREAEKKIFKQTAENINALESKSIFKVFFNWEFHSLVKNWKDLIAFHMTFAKTKFSKTWIGKLYEGISKREISVLEEIYETVSVLSRESIKETRIELTLKNDNPEPYNVFSLFSKEGIFFIYVPAKENME